MSASSNLEHRSSIAVREKSNAINGIFGKLQSYANSSVKHIRRRNNKAWGNVIPPLEERSDGMNKLLNGRCIHEIPDTLQLGVTQSDIKRLECQNGIAVLAVLQTPHLLIERLGLASASVMSSMVKEAYNVDLRELISASAAPLTDDGGQRVLVYMITIMRLTEYTVPNDFDAVVARIEIILIRMREWHITSYGQHMIYDEDIFGPLEADRCIFNTITSTIKLQK